MSGINICRNCGTQVEMQNYIHAPRVRHVATRSTFCGVIGSEGTGGTKEAELLTVDSKEDAIAYRNVILYGAEGIPIPVPKDLRPLSEARPYSRITIIIEEPNKTTTYAIPKARNVEVENKAIPVSPDRLPLRYLTNSTNLSFSLTADHDSEKDHIYLVTESTRGVTVED